jgi:hypothetical protein
MLRRVAWQILTDVSEMLIAFIIRVTSKPSHWSGQASALSDLLQ